MEATDAPPQCPDAAGDFIETGKEIKQDLKEETKEDLKEDLKEELKEETKEETKVETKEGQTSCLHASDTAAQGDAMNSHKEGAHATDQEVKPASATPAPREAHKRKVAMFLAYLGKDYQGMQRNPNARTIEATLEQAIVEAGGVSDQNAGSFTKVSWSRSARTDKGVSALGQVVSMKLLIHDRDVSANIRANSAEAGAAGSTVAKPLVNAEEEEQKDCSQVVDIVREINSRLPSDVVVFGIQRVTGGFCAKNECDRRIYEYVLPTDALDPECFRERQYYIDNHLIDPHNPNSTARFAAEEAEKKMPPRALPTRTKFTDVHRQRMDEILALFTGTNNFHNYTVGMRPGEPKATRYIIDFRCDKTLTLGGTEFLVLRVKGQSFILHQIRKMVGMAIAVMRGAATKDQLKQSLRKDTVVGIPMAPEVGLFLVKCLFENYNKRYASTHDPVDSDLYLDAQNAFKEANVYPHIAKKEADDKTMELWCRNTMNPNRFVDFERHANVAEKSNISNKKRKAQKAQREAGNAPKQHKSIDDSPAAVVAAQTAPLQTDAAEGAPKSDAAMEVDESGQAKE